MVPRRQLMQMGVKVDRCRLDYYQSLQCEVSGTSKLTNAATQASSLESLSTESETGHTVTSTIIPGFLISGLPVPHRGEQYEGDRERDQDGGNDIDLIRTAFRVLEVLDNT